MRFLHIIRWKNLLLIALVQLVLKYYLIPTNKIEQIITDIHFTIIILAGILIAAGGYIINDIYDIQTDQINKPDSVWIPQFTSLWKAKRLYYSITGLGLIFGLLVSFSTEKHLAFLLFLVPVVLLYLYAVKLKKILIVGNITISLLVAFSLLIVLFFESNVLFSVSMMKVIWLFAFFAFSINLLREIVKDIEDSKGDKANGVVSIPIKFGIEKTKRIIIFITGIILSVIVAVSVTQYKDQTLLIIYLLFTVFIALVLFVLKLNNAKHSDEFSKLSNLLKLIMLIGILSVFMIKPI